MPTDLASLRPYLAATWSDREALVAHVAAEVIAQVPSYATTPSSEVWIGMTRILARIVEGDPFAPPTEEDLAAATGTGIQGARAGIAVEDLVAAVLLGAREVEDEVMRRAAVDVSAEVRLEGSRMARRWAEEVAVAAARALMRAGSPEGRDPAADLVDALRSGCDESLLADLVSRAGLDPGGAFVLVVARAPRGQVLDEVDAARLRFAHHGAAWARRDEAVIGVVAGAPSTVGDLVLGTAGPVGLLDLVAALPAADRAARAASYFVGPGCHDLQSLGLLVALHEDLGLRQRLLQHWVEPLAAEPRHDLVRTIRIWQQSGQVDVVARELNVHANTVRNRLARVDALLPGWRTPQAQAELWAALVAQAVD